MNEVTIYELPMTAVEIKAQVQLIQQVMEAVMKDGYHYGKVPGCGDKPALLKPGAEKLLTTFRLAPDPVVEDLSSEDVVRIRVKCNITKIGTGIFWGAGIGECSSDEEKYKWRKSINDQEFNETPEDRRRLKWRRGWNSKPDYQEKQIRTNPADIANTILKMAKKRALVDAALTVTAASDIFEQDLEEMPEEIRESLTEGKQTKPPITPPQAKKVEDTQQPPIGDTIQCVVDKVEKSPKSEAIFITAEDNKFSTFDKKIAEAAKALIGQLSELTYTISADGKYKNLTSITMVTSDTAIKEPF